MTLETVAMETPDSSAISLIDTFFFSMAARLSLGKGLLECNYKASSRRNQEFHQKIREKNRHLRHITRQP
jgi:hypothetical protein